MCGGLKRADAKRELEKRGLVAKLGPGSPATSPEESDTVEKQDPTPGTRLKSKEKVTINIRSQFIDLRTLPDVRDQEFDAAVEILKSAGFENVTRSEGSQASTELENDTVEKQMPEAESQAEVETEVVLTVFTDYARERTVPHVLGLTTTDAKVKLASAGFIDNQVLLHPGSPAPSANQSGTIEEQKPLANETVIGTDKVILKVYSTYVNLVNVPNLHGMTYYDAKKVLKRVGLFIDQRGGGRPPTSQFSKKDKETRS